ncbi:hypothetical protein B296_00012688 [Ensete ventricosum]|uniref:Uncharacterized protein n=1 Tax=Ensete ventricosum TaxID=4639 RepID=A0A426YY29_ENSVE|nr:hypothetical protein B296_00012688 [Ensete ventricosum]
MGAKRSKLEGHSDVGRRRGQKQHWLRLRCDFVAVGGVSCIKGATAIGGRWGKEVHGYCRGGGSGMEQEMVAVVFNLLLAAIKIVGSK